MVSQQWLSRKGEVSRLHLSLTTVHTGPYTAVRWISSRGMAHEASETKPSQEGVGQRTGKHGATDWPTRAACTAGDTRGQVFGDAEWRSGAITAPTGSLSPGSPETPQVSRGKADCLYRAPVGLTARSLMTLDFAVTGPLVPPGLLHASFRPCLAATLLRFPSPSPSPGKSFAVTGLDRGLPPPSCRSCSAHKREGGTRGATLFQQSNQGGGDLAERSRPA